MSQTSVAILGTGNIGTDLLMKILHRSNQLRVARFVGIDPSSSGLKRAQEMGVPTCCNGIEELLETPEFDEVELVFDATSARAHLEHNARLRPLGKQLIDLTPAAIGPCVVPTVNLDQVGDEPNLNLVTCGGQATIPVVHAIERVVPVGYAEIVASISSRSAGPGTRANIDEFTQTTANAIESVGGAAKGKAIIVLNPADPPIMMRNTVFAWVPEHAKLDAIEKSIEQMVTAVQRYVPGYRLKQKVQFDLIDSDSNPVKIPGQSQRASGFQVSVYLEIRGAGDFLPEYAGNLDIMTSAAIATAEQLVSRTVGS